jgi:hypothetical protein
MFGFFSMTFAFQALRCLAFPGVVWRLRSNAAVEITLIPLPGLSNVWSLEEW